jgi:endoglucanase
MGLGWNLGNSFDAGVETAWGNPPATQATIQAIYDAGFRTLRFPITWGGFVGAGPDFTINPARMARVKQIVD